MDNRVDIIEDSLNMWLRNEGGYLEKAIHMTIKEGLFPESDVQFAVNHLWEKLRPNVLNQWLEKVLSNASKVIYTSDINNKVLCLHAGNLPLVGIQDVIAVLLSGASYYGKLSRKDPYLIASYLHVLGQMNPEIHTKWSIDLNSFSGYQFERWMFSGSEESLQKLEKTLVSQQIIKPHAKALRRVAHFSVAWVPGLEKHDFPDLIESMMRYGGKGCRSVAVVYSNIPLDDVADDLRKAAKSWLKQNNYAESASGLLKYRKAYNKAVGVVQADLGTHLIQEGIPSPDFPEIIYWLPPEPPRAVKTRFGAHLQTIYSPTGEELEPGITTEELRNSQKPDIYWRPDGTDPLEWLINI